MRTFTFLTLSARSNYSARSCPRRANALIPTTLMPHPVGLTPMPWPRTQTTTAASALAVARAILVTLPPLAKTDVIVSGGMLHPPPPLPSPLALPCVKNATRRCTLPRVRPAALRHASSSPPILHFLAFRLPPRAACLHFMTPLPRIRAHPLEVVLLCLPASHSIRPPARSERLVAAVLFARHP